MSSESDLFMEDGAPVGNLLTTGKFTPEEENELLFGTANEVTVATTELPAPIPTVITTTTSSQSTEESGPAAEVQASTSGKGRRGFIGRGKLVNRVKE